MINLIKAEAAAKTSEAALRDEKASKYSNVRREEDEVRNEELE